MTKPKDDGRDFGTSDCSSSYPEWICYDCGEKYGRQSIGFHAKGRNGECEICGISKTVTEPHNYGWLKNGWQQMALQSMALDVVQFASIGDQYFIECLRGDDDATKRLRLAIMSLAEVLRTAF